MQATLSLLICASVGASNSKEQRLYWFSAKLPNVGFLRQRDRTTEHSHDYIFIKTIPCDSILGYLDFHKTLFFELTLGNAFSPFYKSRTLTKANLCQTGL